MPCGSVTARVLSAKIETERFITTGKGDDHRNILDLLKEFAMTRQDEKSTFSLVLDNGVEVVIDSDFVVTIPALKALNKSGKITRAIAWRMRDESFPSRCNTPADSIWVGTDYGDDARRVLYAFSVAIIRCSLVLEMENGPEISICPSLKPDVPATDEQGRGEFDYKSRPIWEVEVSLWPMLESWLGIETAPAESAK